MPYICNYRKINFITARVVAPMLFFKKSTNLLLLIERNMNLKVQELDAEINQKLCKKFSNGFKRYVRVGESGWLLPEEYLKFAEDFRNFQTRSTDVWIMCYPRNASTFTQDLCWLILNDLDMLKYMNMEHNLIPRVEFFERLVIKGKIKEREDFSEEQKSILKNLIDCKEPRIIKSHLPFELAPSNLLTSGCKVIYLARNIKDQAVSYFELQSMKIRTPFLGSFEEYWQLLEDDLLLYTPYWKHIGQAWEKNPDQLLFLNYEDMKMDLRDYISKLSIFLNKKLTENQLNELEKFCSFQHYRHISIDKTFACKGITGRWKIYFTDNLNVKANKWIESGWKNNIASLKYANHVNISK